MLERLYRNSVIRFPLVTMLLMLGVAAVLGSYIPQVKLDASSDSLVLEGDNALEVYRQTALRYGSDDFLIVTFKPKGDLLSDDSLARLKSLQDELAAVDVVSKVTSILDVPLLESPPVSLSDLGDTLPTLSDPTVDRELVRKEFRESPVYCDLLTNAAGDVTMMQVMLKDDPEQYRLRNARDDLRALKRERSLNSEEAERLSQATQAYKDYVAISNEQRDAYIKQIRGILQKYKVDAQIFLGGVPMIAADMITFIQSDLQIFGVGLLVFIVVLLGIIFHSLRWVVLPLLTCVVTAVSMLGFLAAVDWRMTVISSNFVALLLIITLSICIHLVVRYRELLHSNPEYDKREIVMATVDYMFRPCVYTSLTTIVAFASLVVSGIRPVIDFGWMMTIGISLALIVAFTVLPAGMVLWGKGGAGSSGGGAPSITHFFAIFTDRRRHWVTGLSLGLLAMSIAGISQLKVENRFIDYFDESTEIYQGMLTIDEEFGGTVPLDILIKAPAVDEVGEIAITGDDPFADEFAEPAADEFADPFADEFAGDGASEFRQSPWFTVDGLSQIERIHDHLDSLPETGKVLSLGTFYKVVKKLMNGVDDIQLAVMQDNLPTDIDTVLVKPYLSLENDQARISLRVKETSRDLRRNQFLEDVHAWLVEEADVAPENITLTGMLVLYNNMLQSLFTSQIQTLGFVFVAIMIMFMILFRSLSIALIAIAPNILAALMVLGCMGWLGMPLDIMTITIAAICVGIGVDDTIHYIHRFKDEFAVDGSYQQAMYRSHASIGSAMYYTSATIVIGFSVLTLSNFTPSIYFGILTGVAMLAALLGAMTLLPRLLLIVKPLGPERG